jgi:predicted nucleotidyltransferase component of viral defense system
MLWEEIVNKSSKRGERTHQVFQEEVQKAILASLSRGGAFTNIVFQGGTSLRLFYGNPRFSEDLDFVLRQKRTCVDLIQNIPKIRAFVKDTFPFLKETDISIQKNDQGMQRLIFKTISDIPDQRLRIHIELVYVPSHYNKPRILDCPPLNPVVRVEEPFEILADKIIALGNRSYLKGRDIWDIYFLITKKHVSIPWNLVFQKSRDYGSTPSNLKKNILIAGKRLREEGISILSSEMMRFLPKPALDQYSELFDEIANKVAEEVESVKNVKTTSIKGESDEG